MTIEVNVTQLALGVLCVCACGMFWLLAFLVHRAEKLAAEWQAKYARASEAHLGAEAEIRDLNEQLTIAARSLRQRARQATFLANELRDVDGESPTRVVKEGFAPWRPSN